MHETARGAQIAHQHICAILVFLADFQGRLDPTSPPSCLYGRAGGEGRSVYKELQVNLEDQSQFHKDLQPAHHPFKFNYFP